jgi:hypothetical protein
MGTALLQAGQKSVNISQKSFVFKFFLHLCYIKIATEIFKHIRGASSKVSSNPIFSRHITNEVSDYYRST